MYSFDLDYNILKAHQNQKKNTFMLYLKRGR